jgi:CheY-like chemotaxis protein
MLAAPRSGATAETAVESNPSADGETEWSWRLPAAEVEALSLRVAQTAAASGNLLARARDMGEPLRALAPELRQLARATARLRRQLWRLRSAEPPDRQLRRRDGMPEARGEEVVRVAAGHRGFCLPIASVERAVALSPADRDRLRAERVLSFGGRRLPLLFLSPLTANGSTNETAAIVLRRGRRLMALAVDRAVGREEIVVHHLFGLLEAHPFVAGAALAADGEVLLQLDVERLFALCTHEALLPVDEAAAAEPVDAAAGLGVLVVDDSQVVRQLASRFLAAGGYQIDTAVDGLDALDKLASGRFRAVVTDVEMPGLDGFELLRALRGDARWSHLPVIVCTTLADEAHRTRAFELGANAFLTKPFSREQLCEQLSRLLAADEASSGLDAADEPGADRRH